MQVSLIPNGILKNIPDAVVVNLFQNDCYLTTAGDHEQFKYRFGKKAPDERFIIESYKTFIKDLRNKYKRAHIVCVLGNMMQQKKARPGLATYSKRWSNYMIQKFTSIFFRLKIRRPSANCRTGINGTKPYWIY